jgi:putative colanic acid biosynthesis acetyltransferase WcaF
MSYLFSSNSEDPFDRPVFSLRHRFLRLCWQIVWLLFFRITPIPFFACRACILRFFGAEVGISTYVYPNVRIWAPWQLVLGDKATLGPGVEVYNPGGVHLGHHAIVSQDAYLCGGSHDFNDLAFPMTWAPIVLEPYSWICARAVVLPGVTVGKGAILGAAAVISKDMDPLGVYVGNPARMVTSRDPSALPIYL